MKMQKLLSMAPAEIVTRGRQAVFKTAERVRHVKRSQEHQIRDMFSTLIEGSDGAKEAASLYRAGDINAAMLCLQANFRATTGPSYFAGAGTVTTTELISNYLPAVRSDIIRSADAVCAGNFHILGYGRLRFTLSDTPPAATSERINWHLDAVSGTVSPLVHWSRINALDFDQVGDSKVVWELNRHQWLIQLGLAWHFTSSKKYAATFCQHLHSWMQDNPPGYGINWSSSLEVAYRLISWTWALVLFKDSADISAQFMTAMMSSLKTHAEHIERYLSTYYSPNTHLTGEALALYYAGIVFPDLGGSARWRALGRTILLQQFTRQVYDDGVYFEQSTRYQYYTTEIYLQFMILSKRNGERMPSDFYTRLQAMVDFLLNLRRPDGTLPQIGDTDGGELFTLVHRQPGDFKVLFSLAAALFEREDYAWAAGDSTAELICLLGSAGHYRFMAIKQKSPPCIESRLFANGGYLIMRDGWRKQGRQLIIDLGPLGCTESAGHGHADLLAIQASAFGDNYLVDAGTGSYTGEPQWRNYFRSTRAHSTVSVDGLSQVVPDGPFSWHGTRPHVWINKCGSATDMSIIDVATDAWINLAGAVTHRRRVVFIRRSYWVVVDDLDATTAHTYDLRYQFSDLPVQLDANGWVRATGKNGSCLLLHISANQTPILQIECGCEDPPAGWFSANYGQRTPAPALSCTLNICGPARFVTVLYPQPDSDASPPAMSVDQPAYKNSISTLRIKTDECHEDQIEITEDDINVNHRATLCAV